MQKLQKKIRVFTIVLLLSSMGISTMSYGIFGIFGGSSDNKSDVRQNSASTIQDEEEITDEISRELAEQRTKQLDDFAESQKRVMEIVGKKWQEEASERLAKIEELTKQCSDIPDKCQDVLDDFHVVMKNIRKKYAEGIGLLADELRETNELKNRKIAAVKRYEAARCGIQKIIESIGGADHELIAEIKKYEKVHGPQETYEFAKEVYEKKVEDLIVDITDFMQKVELNDIQKQNINTLIKDGELTYLVSAYEKLKKEYETAEKSKEELLAQENEQEEN